MHSPRLSPYTAAALSPPSASPPARREHSVPTPKTLVLCSDATGGLISSAAVAVDVLPPAQSCAATCEAALCSLRTPHAVWKPCLSFRFQAALNAESSARLFRLPEHLPTSEKHVIPPHSSISRHPSPPDADSVATSPTPPPNCPMPVLSFSGDI